MSMQSSPPPGRGRALLIGVITFVVVFLLIVGATISVQVFRSLNSPGPSASATPADPEATDPEDPEATSDPFADDGEEQYCWQNLDVQRTSENPSGRLRGGGLEVAAPDGFDQRSNATRFAFTDDPQVAGAEAETNWNSIVMIGQVTWQPGYDYPGEEVAAERILDCYISNAGVWDDVTSRRPENRESRAVTIDDMPGHQASVDLMFQGDHSLEVVEGAAITVVVVDTPEGPSVLVTEASIGIPEHEEAAVETLDSLSGLTG